MEQNTGPVLWQSKMSGKQTKERWLAILFENELGLDNCEI